MKQAGSKYEENLFLLFSRNLSAEKNCSSLSMHRVKTWSLETDDLGFSRFDL